MRSYLIDQINVPDMERVTHYLSENATASHLESLFWVGLPERELSPAQSLHKDCGPHVFSIEIGKDWMRLEFLIRTLKGLGCECSGYATEGQKICIIRYADKMIKDLNILT